MRTMLGVASLVVVTCCSAWLAPLGAHELRRGRLVLTSGAPIAGQSVDLEVVILGADERPTPLIDTQVFVTADMTAHPMAPVTAELKSLLSDRKRAGTLRFTMSGQWRLTLEIVEPDEDERVAVVPLTVLPAGAAASLTPTVINFGLDVPLRPTVFDPWQVVWASLALVAAAELIALSGSLRRRRRSRGLPTRPSLGPS